MKKTIMLVMLLALAAVQAQVSGKGYLGEITEDGTEVRSGPSDKAYVCAELGKSAKIRVVSSISDDWLVVSQPQQCFSVIGQENVKLDSESKKEGKYKITHGTVTAEKATLFAAGYKRKSAFTAPQVHLKKGDRVRKIGSTRDGLWYILLPPKNARFYVRSSRVKRAEPKPAESDLTPIEFKPVPKEIKPPKIEDTTGTPKTPKEPKETKPKSGYSVDQLQKDVLLESGKPLEKRDFNALLAKARKLKVAKDSGRHSTYTSLVAYIKSEIRVAKKSREIDNIVSNALKQGAEPDVTPVTSGSPGKYDLEGTLSISRLYSLDPKEVRRYRVINPESGRNIGYVVDPSGEHKLESLVGRRVGVKGKFEFNNKLGLQVLTADKVKLLEPEPVTPGVLKPIKPEPAKPEPIKPEPVKPEPVKPEPIVPVKPEPVKPEPVKPEPVKPEPVKPEPIVPVKPEPVKPEPVKPEPVKPEPVKPEPVKPELVKPEPVKPEPVKPEPIVPVKPEPVKPEPVKPEPVKPEPIKPEPVKPEPVKPEPVKPEPIKPEPVKPEPVKPEPVKPEPIKPEPIRPEPIKPEPINPIKVEPIKPEPIKPEPIKPIKVEPIKPAPIKPEPIKPDIVSKDPKKPETKLPELKVPVIPESTKEGVEIEWD